MGNILTRTEAELNIYVPRHQVKDTLAVTLVKLAHLLLGKVGEYASGEHCIWNKVMDTS